VGGLPDDFFMQAEEYDLSLRLLDAGWDVRRFEDLRVYHLKTLRARSTSRVMRLDVRNNIVLIARYFPRRWVWAFGWDWTLRYFWIARANGQLAAFARGLLQGLVRVIRGVQRRPVTEETFELFARLGETAERLAIQRDELHLRSIVLVDFGKNVLAYRRAARACGVRIAAIADPRLASAHFHGIPVVTDAKACAMTFDAAVIANLSPVHAARRAIQWRRLQGRPVIDLFDPALDAARAATDAITSSSGRGLPRSRRTVARSA
jgi:hypothetical protein